MPRDKKRRTDTKPKKRVVSGRRLSRRASSSSTIDSPEPEPPYRPSRSRSVSHFANPEDYPVQKRCWVSAEPQPNAEQSSLEAVKEHLKTYRGYFTNYQDPRDRSFQQDPRNSPTVQLEYPNTTALEKFIVLAPRDGDHYNPIMDLEQTLYCIVRSAYPSKESTLDPSRRAVSLSISTKHPPTSPPVSTTSNDDFSDDLPSKPRILRRIQRAVHLKDGPAFMAALDEANKVLCKLKYPPVDPDIMDDRPCPPNRLLEGVSRWEDKELPKDVLMRILEENYQRSVGPWMGSLKKYEAFSQNVYGELMPSLVYKIIRQTGLNADSLFLDLGSGVGNIVAQASLQTGCRSYGIELAHAPAEVAARMVPNLRARAHMWGIKCGEIEVEEGDMLKSSRVNELMSQADVVLIDNKAFPPRVNEELRPKFLDLKEGAYVISLVPFAQTLSARVTQRNVDDISTIFEVHEFQYHSGDVSWGNGGGTYYVHRVDRKGYAEMRTHLERSSSSRSSSGRSSRRRS
ncbi:Histone-lysine N-methyltransferase, H3 lysine-79 specific [Mycena chlorophos]|uniref:Histone-lysine N-methyltransferase, H3 lysine-79 specific n=1 Tax=Mycena chlorophos TaxID=658473 RepID=A0A8H6T533_MYCCL|nr:Histone-lysine N-methyltransferase, H3 lysine-79 specific [Mycena chlorophos]